jgi:hypothetical protein
MNPPPPVTHTRRGGAISPPLPTTAYRLQVPRIEATAMWKID